MKRLILYTCWSCSTCFYLLIQSYRNLHCFPLCQKNLNFSIFDDFIVWKQIWVVSLTYYHYPGRVLEMRNFWITSLLFLYGGTVLIMIILNFLERPDQICNRRVLHALIFSLIIWLSCSFRTVLYSSWLSEKASNLISRCYYWYW